MSLTQKQIEVVSLFHKYGGSEIAVAKHLGIDRKAVISQLWYAHKKGAFNESHKQVLPQDFTAKAVSVMHRPNGEIIAQWTKADKNAFDTELYLEFLKQYTPVQTKLSKSPKKVQKDLMLEIPVYDAHIGMLAWEKETGNNYDTKIAKHLQVSAFKLLVQEFGLLDHIVIYLGGDNQTIDNRSNMTEKSGNIVDTDSRYHRMAWCTYETNHACIDLALRMAKKVSVIVLSGNHDWHSAIHLAMTLHAHYRKEKRVFIHTSPERHKFFCWGNNVFMASHGDQDEKRLATYMLNQIIKRDFGNPTNMMMRLGHLHKRGKVTPPGLVEHDGVIIERFPTLAAQEAYSIEAGYTSVRATSAVLWHKEYGRYGGREISLGEILDKYPI